jgi:hypothetical protein
LCICVQCYCIKLAKVMSKILTFLDPFSSFFHIHQREGKTVFHQIKTVSTKILIDNIDRFINQSQQKPFSNDNSKIKFWTKNQPVLSIFAVFTSKSIFESIFLPHRAQLLQNYNCNEFIWYQGIRNINKKGLLQTTKAEGTSSVSRPGKHLSH